MKVLDPGHAYSLEIYDRTKIENALFNEPRLFFMKREGEGYPGNEGHHPGTNMQEVMRVLIDRLKYLDWQSPHVANRLAIEGLRRAIVNLENRAREKRGQGNVFIDQEIETIATCKVCGHIYCLNHEKAKEKV